MDTATRKIRLLVVDDHPLIRQGLAAAARASSDCEVVGEAAHPSGLEEQITRLMPDVVVLDIRLGMGGSGIEVARDLRRRFASLKILVLSNYDNQAYAQEFHRIGVNGYLLKTASTRAVMDAVRAVADGETVFDPAILQRMNQGRAGVTSREVEVLQLAAEGLSNAEIGKRLSISVAGVQVCLTSAFNKLGVRNRTAAVVRAANLGLIVLGDDGT